MYYPDLEYTVQYIPVYPLPVAYPNNMPYDDSKNPYNLDVYQIVDNYNYVMNDRKYFLPDVNTIRMHAAEALVKIKMKKENIYIELPSIYDIQKELFEPSQDWDYYTFFAMHGKIPKNAQRMFEYTLLAKELDVMQGDSEGHFNPYDEITRAEILTIIDRILQNE